MSWFFIALAAPFLWSLVNIIDQYLVTKYVKKQSGFGGLIIFISLVGIPVSLLIGIFTTGVFQAPILDKLLLVGVGGITVAWTLLYLFALGIEGVSTAALWFLTIPIFGYVLGYVFLGETLSLRQIIGSLIILFGLFLVSINWSSQKSNFKWRFSLYMITSCFLCAITGIIFKYVTVGNTFWVSSFWQYAGLGFFGILIYLFVPKYRHEFMSMIGHNGKNILATTTISEVLNIGGNLFSNYAILLAPVAVVYTITDFQPAIIFLLTVFCTFFLPSIVKEDLGMRVILPKIAAIALVIVGSVVLFVQ